MLDALAQYERVEAKNTVEQLLAIPWFAARKNHLYRLISAYNQIIKNLPEGRAHPSAEQQAKFNKCVGEFVREMKILTDFDTRDEARISWLLTTPEYMDHMVQEILENLR